MLATLFSLLALFPIITEANTFANKHVRFELPPGWTCDDKNHAWSCISYRPKERKQATIALVVTAAGPNNNLDHFLKQLQQPRQRKQRNGAITKSHVLSTGKRMIGNQPWVEAVHSGSEMADYYTHYLATIKDGIVVVMTLNAHSLHQAEYSKDFLQAVESLRLVDPRSTQKTLVKNEILTGQDMENINATDTAPKLSRWIWHIVAGLFLIVGAGAGYLWWDKK